MKLRSVGVMASIGLSCILLAGCGVEDLTGINMGLLASNPDYKVNQQPEWTIQPMVDKAYGEDLVYISPEAEKAMAKDNETFAANVIAAIENPEAAKLLRGVAKGANADYVQPRLDLLKARFGDQYDQIPPRMVRDLVWDDARLNAVLTNDAAAERIVAAAKAHKNSDDRRPANAPSLSEFLGPALPQVSSRTGS